MCITKENRIRQTIEEMIENRSDRSTEKCLSENLSKLQKVLKYQMNTMKLGKIIKIVK